MNQLDWKAYAEVARQAAAEGCVLLKNEDKALPLKKDECVAVFGRAQLHYYKSGTGSGGMVNAPYTIGIAEGLKQSGHVKMDEQIHTMYVEWEKENPFDTGLGWAQEPWCQKEMPLSEETIREAAERNQAAIMILGRTAGEDKDNSAAEGSYLLTKEEEDILGNVCKYFKRSIVVLNTGNPIDMKWVKHYEPAAVLYAWQGGMEGGNGAADVLTGAVTPCGKLSDTIADDILDYPSTKYFGGKSFNLYQEDIYVGYRYFETIAREKVSYCFGFGLSYTEFAVRSGMSVDYGEHGDRIMICVKVKNTGSAPGKEVVQVYYAPAQGKLSKPLRNLIRFAKTRLLQPGESEELSFEIAPEEMASYDDSGCTGNQSCWVLEEGTYQFYVGTDVRTAEWTGTWEILKPVVTKRLTKRLAPVRSFHRMKLEQAEDDSFVMKEEEVPLRDSNRSAGDSRNQIGNHGQLCRTEVCVDKEPEAAYLGDQGYKLLDVAEGKCSMAQFLSQLPDKELICLTRGEGMCSPKVTAGTAAAFGGVTDELQKFGIPVACCADGPSGIRMDCGTKAFSIPGGMALACGFNTELVEKLFEFVGMELRKNKIDTILGPGMNLHRNPLNGRNFEYFSEDPYLTGKLAVSQLKGLEKWGVTGTLKHFACNNQEYKRHDTDSVVSERALREIYLKGFEIAVKEGKAYSMMSTYGALNGLWTAGNYELLTNILREEWGFEGIVMTDWWAKINEEGEEASVQNTVPMVRAQNDLYMVTASAALNSQMDNTEEGLREGRISRAYLIRNAGNILGAILRMPAAKQMAEAAEEWEDINLNDEEEKYRTVLQEVIVEGDCELDVQSLTTKKGSSSFYYARIPEKGSYRLQFRLKAEAEELAQIPMSVFVNNQLAGTISLKGSQKDWITQSIEFDVFVAIHNYIKLYFGESGMVIEKIELKSNRSCI